MIDEKEIEQVLQEFVDLSSHMTNIDLTKLPIEDLMILTHKNQRLVKIIKEINDFERYLIVKDAILKMK